MEHSRASRNRLNPRHLELFPGDGLFDRIARTVCRASCLPRKELYESWEVARRVRRRFRGGRVIELACGHGLVSQILMLLDPSSPAGVAVDRRLPPSARAVAEAMAMQWPRLRHGVTRLEADLETVELHPSDLVVSAHACGGLTDRILERAAAARARVAVLPCCHHLATSDLGGLQGWLDGPLAVDVVRAQELRRKGYRIFTQTIPPEITPRNRLLLAEPLP